MRLPRRIDRPERRVEPRIVESREQPRPLVLHVLLIVIGSGFGSIMAGVADSPTERLIGLAVASVFPLFLVWDVLRCRQVAFTEDALIVGGQRFPWSDVEETDVREVPIGRAGLFVRLSDDARRRLALPAPRYRKFGVGLEPAPSAEIDAKRYDLFLRAHGDRLESWFYELAVRRLRRDRIELVAAVHTIERANTVTLNAGIVRDDSIGVTIQLIAPSIDALLVHAKSALEQTLPDDARWNPEFTRGVMLFVGPISLAKDARADEAIEAVKLAARAAISGNPRIISAAWVEPRQPS